MTRRNNDEWRGSLDPDRYRILREGGTEPPGSGALLHNKKQGMYRCGGCGAPLFESATKYDRGPESRFAVRIAKGISGMSFPMARARQDCATASTRHRWISTNGLTATVRRRRSAATADDGACRAASEPISTVPQWLPHNRNPGRAA